jgi:RimJ/RimL family protein N-acetyltransferase
VDDVYRNNGYNTEAARKTCGDARIKYNSFGACVDDVYRNNGYNTEAARKTCDTLIAQNHD